MSTWSSDLSCVVSARNTCAGALAVLLAGSALAHDLHKPPFRGGPGATSQSWDFEDPNDPNNLVDLEAKGCVPEANPNGNATADSDGMWLDMYDGLQGIICLAEGDTIEIDIANQDDPNKTKIVWVQATFHRHFDGVFSDLTASVNPPAVPVFQYDVGVPGAGASWVHRTWIFVMNGCPANETITFTAVDGHVDVDQLVADTWCKGEEPFVPPTPAQPGDFDGDGLPDFGGSDPCPYDPLNIDSDGDGVADACECTVECAPGATQEPELCGMNINDGCALPHDPVVNTQCCTSWCGESYAFAGLIDQDTYRFPVADTNGDLVNTVTVTITAEMPLRFEITSDACGLILVYGVDHVPAGGTISLSAIVPAPSVVRVNILPGDPLGPIFDGHPCGTPTGYIVDFDCAEGCGGPAPCPGDADGDRDVDLDDLLLVLGNFGGPGPAGDVDGDGDVDLDDLLLVLGNFGNVCP